MHGQYGAGDSLLARRSREADAVLIIRGTAKLRGRLKAAAAGPDDVSTTVLGDWFANALHWHSQVAVLMNARTYVPVFLSLAPAATLPARIPDAIAGVLRRLGADDAFIESELAAMADVRLAPTNDRSRVTSMNDFAFHGKLGWDMGDFATLEDLSVGIADMPTGALRYRSPEEALAEVLGLNDPRVRRRRMAPAPTPGSAPTAVYQLKVTLRGTTPPRL